MYRLEHLEAVCVEEKPVFDHTRVTLVSLFPPSRWESALNAAVEDCKTKGVKCGKERYSATF